LNHGEEFFGQLVRAGSDAAEVLQLGGGRLDKVPFAVQSYAEVWFRPPVGLGRDIGERSFLTERCPDAIGILGLVSEHDGYGTHIVEQAVSRLPVVALPSGQAQPDRETSPIDARVDFGREPASGTTETIISRPPLFAVAACWWARTEVLSIIWMSPSCAVVMASIIRSQTPAFRHRTKRF
jgi:hypothetical protein